MRVVHIRRYLPVKEIKLATAKINELRHEQLKTKTQVGLYYNQGISQVQLYNIIFRNSMLCVL